MLNLFQHLIHKQRIPKQVRIDFRHEVLNMKIVMKV